MLIVVHLNQNFYILDERVNAVMHQNHISTFVVYLKHTLFQKHATSNKKYGLQPLYKGG